ncbi:MAG: TonB-dependent receptor, partial [Anaerolineales bacterium]|nr:TonB-dependent receptor [Anaerolineales bacterium]
ITSKLSVIPGIRYEQNQTTYTALFLNADWIVGSPVQIYDTATTSRQNSYWLPNLQMKYEPIDWLQLRFGYSNTLARPNYTSLIPRTVVTSTNTISQNEFYLRPEQSQNFDFMVSVKQNHLGLFTMGAFVKNIDDKILSAPPRYMFDASEYYLDSAKYSGYLISTQFNNEYTTYVKGLEFDLQTVFWFLPGPLKGLVLNTNYTYTHSESKYKTTEIDKRMDPNTFLTTITNIDSFFVDRLRDQPAHVVNVSLGYDYKGFSVRVSMNYQSDMFRGISLFPEERSYSDGLTRWDVALKQELPVPGLQVYANVNNITGVIETDIMGTATRLPVHKEFYGTTFTLGVRWRMQ